MRYFDYLSDGDGRSLFSRPPEPFDKTAKRELLRDAVGGLLYIPATNPDIAEIILSGKVRGLTSMAVCLEDSVGDHARAEGIENAGRQFARLLTALEGGRLSPDRLPLLFVRVKDNDMLEQMAGLFVKYSRVLTGVILPKVSREGLERGLSLTAEIGGQASDPFYAMPILEGPDLMLERDRIGLLQDFRSIADRYYDQILNIRVGATDLSGLYGIRRAADTPIYSVSVVGACIGDVVRIFGIGDRYTISGPVWEYYSTPARGRALGQYDEIAGLLNELRLDVQNGIWGKTCVHPSQLLPVQASYVVSYERYHDALAVAGGNQGEVGVLASARHNKMNELKPHALWASKVLRRAGLYGVYQENTDCAGLMRALCAGGWPL